MPLLAALTRSVKQAVEHRFHCRLYRNSLPKGADLFADLRRYGYANFIHTVCDVGANVGDFARAALTAIPQAHVFAFEPTASTSDRLIASLGSHPRITVFPHALGATETRAKLRLHPESRFNALATLTDATAESTPFEWVQVRRLDQVLGPPRQPRIDLLKTDTEGFDLEVLRGASRLLDEGRIALVLTEVAFHPDDRRHTQFTAACSFLQDYGFDLVGFYHQSHFRRLNTLDYCDALFINPATVEPLRETRQL